VNGPPGQKEAPQLVDANGGASVKGPRAEGFVVKPNEVGCSLPVNSRSQPGASMSVMQGGPGEGGGCAEGAPPPPRALTCPPIVQLSPSASAGGAWKQGKNAARIIEIEISAACQRYGIEHVGMITFSSCGGDRRTLQMPEFSKRFDSFNKNCLGGVFVCWLAVIQRHKDGAPHAHMIVVSREVLGGPLHWRKDKKQWWCAATDACKALWDVFTPDRMAAYGLGVLRLHPIRDGDAAGAYVARYVSRELGTRRKEDRGARLVRYSQSWQRVVVGPFTWADWRATRARRRGEKLGERLWGSMSKMVADLGPCWRWHLRRSLYAQDLVFDCLLAAVEHDLEYFHGPRFALDQRWEQHDIRAAECAKRVEQERLSLGAGAE
jgi:hypothetical protein